MKIDGIDIELNDRVKIPSFATKEEDVMNIHFDDTIIYHRLLKGRDEDNQHPISAITGLQAALDSKSEFSGSYNDLTDKPTLFSGDYNDLTNKPTISNKKITIKQGGVTKGYFTLNQLYDDTINLELGLQTIDWDDVTNKPTFADVATSGSYTDLTDTPVDVSYFYNDAGYLTQHQDLSDYVKDSELAPVAKSGSYTDLTDTPTIPEALSDLTDDSTHRLVTDSQISAWNAKGTYSKPSSGIPKTDLASAVQTSLGLADSALQSFTETDPIFTASAAYGISSSDISNWNSKTSNIGTITSVKMNGTTISSSGEANLGTVLTQHQSIKTINSTSLVGTGNVTVQETLVSGTNIKTINGNSLLGSGNIVISGGGGSSQKVYTDYVEEYRSEGTATFVGRNDSSASTSDTTWSLRVIWHSPLFTIYDYNNVAWDDRYDYPIINN